MSEIGCLQSHAVASTMHLILRHAAQHWIDRLEQYRFLRTIPSTPRAQQLRQLESERQTLQAPDMARLGDPAQTSSQCWKMDRNDPAPRLGKRSASGGGPAAPVPGLCRGASRSEWRRRSNPGMLVSPATRGSCCRRKHSRGPTAAASRRFFMAKVGYEVIGALLRATRGALEPAESRRGPAIAVAAGDDYGLHPIRVRRSSHSLVDDRVQQRTLVRLLGIVRIRHTAPRLS